MIMKKENFVDILKDTVKKPAATLALGHQWVFQQDNESKHTSKLVQNLFRVAKRSLIRRASLVKRWLSGVSQKGCTIVKL